MLSRQRNFLYLLHCLGRRTERLRAVKLGFLVRQEILELRAQDFFDFVPYKYGPYSFALYHDAAKLISQGYLCEPDEKMWGVTTKCQSEFERIPSSTARQMRELAATYRDMPLKELVRTVYSTFPWYTANALDAKKRQMNRPVADPDVYTAGYEGCNVDAFFNGILMSGIQRIVDIRDNPTARRFGFHGSRMHRIADMLNLGYIHIAELGVPSSQRSNLGSPDSYRRLFDAYRRRILLVNQDAMKSLAQEMEFSPSALLCMEKDPMRCHRSVLAEEISEVSGLRIVHLDTHECTVKLNENVS